MLIILKIFKLKLLLFLPFILGLTGLKKILGLAALVVPGKIIDFVSPDVLDKSTIDEGNKYYKLCNNASCYYVCSRSFSKLRDSLKASD